MSFWAQLNLHNRNSPLIDQIIKFHDYLITLTVIVTTLVLFKISIIILSQQKNFKLREHHGLEVVWTSIPGLLLLGILFPSIKILYQIEENNPLISLKIVGHQWYWSYEVLLKSNLEFDSYILKSPHSFRLLDSDRRITLPFNSLVRSICSSTDVIHAWTIPSLAIKSDAVPGRINQINFLLHRPGIFYGQCSEICGANHSFIPISLESISLNKFLKFLKLIDGRLRY